MLMNFMDACQGLGPIVGFVKAIFWIIQIVIPIGLVIMGSIDLGKAVLSSDDKEIKAATGKLVKRAIAAVAVFFLVLIVRLLMNTVASNNAGDESSEGQLTANSWWACWDEAN